MITAVKTREFKRELDYDWEDYFPSDKNLSVEAGKVHRAVEGAYVDSRFVALFRPETDIYMTLGISVSTNRSDAVGRPIRTIAFLRAETPEETDLLIRLFAECLRKPDAETIYNAESEIAKAVESLYQTKKLDGFLRFCRSLPTVNGRGVKVTERWAIPRGDECTRREMSESLSSPVKVGESFLIALTDRLQTDVLGSLGSMFDHAVVRIFSSATTAREKLPGPASQKHHRAAAIGGVVLVALFVAAIGTCSRRGRDGGRKSESQTPESFEVSATNTVQHQKWSGRLTGEIEQGGHSFGYSAAYIETSKPITLSIVNKNVTVQ